MCHGLRHCLFFPKELRFEFLRMDRLAILPLNVVSKKLQQFVHVIFLSGSFKGFRPNDRHVTSALRLVQRCLDGGVRASSAAASIDARASGVRRRLPRFGYSDALQRQAAASLSRRPYGAIIPGRQRRPDDSSRAASWSSLLFFPSSLPSIGRATLLEKRGEKRGLHFTRRQCKEKGKKWASAHFC